MNQIEALLQASVREPDSSATPHRLPNLDLLKISIESTGRQTSPAQMRGGRALHPCGPKLGRELGMGIAVSGG